MVSCLRLNLKQNLRVIYLKEIMQHAQVGYLDHLILQRIQEDCLGKASQQQIISLVKLIQHSALNRLLEQQEGSLDQLDLQQI